MCRDSDLEIPVARADLPPLRSKGDIVAEAASGEASILYIFSRAIECFYRAAC